MKKLLFLVIIIIASCKPKPINLFKDFYSYDSFSAIEKKMKDREIYLSGKKETVLFVIDSNAMHFNEQGTLRLMLYEDKLAGVGFYPYNVNSYLDTINSIYNINWDNKTKVIDKRLIVNLTFEEFHNDLCFECKDTVVAWGDKVLLEKYEDRIWGKKEFLDL